MCTIQWDEMRWGEYYSSTEVWSRKKQKEKKKKKINPKPWKIFHYVISHEEKEKTRAIWGGMGVDTSFFPRGKKKNLHSAEYKNAKK